MIVELAQLPGVDGDIPANTASALDAIARCGPDTRLLVFPETYLSGFPTADNIASLAQPIAGPAIRTIQQAARDKNISIAIGFAEAHEGRFYNTTALLTPHGVALAYRKTHLWASDHGIFTPGDALVSCEWDGLRVGILIWLSHGGQYRQPGPAHSRPGHPHHPAGRPRQEHQ
ncbi:nitrilase-related carbon-nitrogen hydrolase, partial [Aquitalea magnusonii]|uniref:nitrilase-related carbon-nitrogen hydrolase n=1 Tax=Aquitalea magnusonii TaxID=332411 RepID=UPI0023BA5914